LYIAKVPWYLEGGDPSVSHQGRQDEKRDDGIHNWQVFMFLIILHSINVNNKGIGMNNHVLDFHCSTVPLLLWNSLNGGLEGNNSLALTIPVRFMFVTFRSLRFFYFIMHKNSDEKNSQSLV
jgi:hypothetical protein